MTRPKYPKTDANAAQIAADLDAADWPHIRLDVSSLPVAKAGGDWFIGGYSERCKEFRWLLVEIKQPGEGLTDSEFEIFSRLCTLDGHGDYAIAFTADDILQWFGVK